MYTLCDYKHKSSHWQNPQIKVVNMEDPCDIGSWVSCCLLNREGSEQNLIFSKYHGNRTVWCLFILRWMLTKSPLDMSWCHDFGHTHAFQERLCGSLKRMYVIISFGSIESWLVAKMKWWFVVKIKRCHERRSLNRRVRWI